MSKDYITMDLANAVVKAYKKQWSYINNFTVDIMFSSEILQEAGVSWTNNDREELALNMRNFNVPQLGLTPINVWSANMWRMSLGRLEPFTFTMGFRDSDQMYYYNKFVKIFLAQQPFYLDDIGMSIILKKDADYTNQSSRTIWKFEKCRIDNVSQVQFSNETEAQIAEFDIQVTSKMPLHIGI